MKYQTILVWLALLAVILLLIMAPAFGADIRSKIGERRPHLPSPASLGEFTLVQGYVIALPWCAATGAMLTSALLKRPLTLSEAWQIVGGCVIPVIGALVMRDLFERHPEWSKLPLPPVWRVEFGISSQS